MDDPIPPNIPSSLESVRITSLPSSFYYIPNFLTPAEQNALLQKVPPAIVLPPSPKILTYHYTSRSRPTAGNISPTAVSKPTPPP